MDKGWKNWSQASFVCEGGVSGWRRKDKQRRIWDGCDNYGRFAYMTFSASCRTFRWPMRWTVPGNLCQAAVTILPICHISYEFYDLFKIMNKVSSPVFKLYKKERVSRRQQHEDVRVQSSCHLQSISLIFSRRRSPVEWKRFQLKRTQNEDCPSAFAAIRCQSSFWCGEGTFCERGCEGMIHIFHHVMKDGFTFPSPNRMQFPFWPEKQRGSLTIINQWMR